MTNRKVAEEQPLTSSLVIIMKEPIFFFNTNVMNESETDVYHHNILYGHYSSNIMFLYILGPIFFNINAM